MTYEFDRYLRYDELVAWLHEIAAAHPDLVALETYGRSHEGRDLWLVTVTDASTGAHDTQAGALDRRQHPRRRAHRQRGGVLDHRSPRHRPSRRRPDRRRGAAHPDLLRRARASTPTAPSGCWPTGPRYRRSSTRAWPWRDAHRWPGLHVEDVDGDGRILSIRIPDPNGGWTAHPDDPRLMVPVPPAGPAGRRRRATACSPRARSPTTTGSPSPRPRAVEGLDLNRNFPAGWGTGVTGSGDHPLSEPEVDALVRAIGARPNICGYNAFHTSGGVLLRPSSVQPDAKLPRFDIVGLDAAGRGRHAPHRLHGALRVRGLHVGSRATR